MTTLTFRPLPCAVRTPKSEPLRVPKLKVTLLMTAPTISDLEGTACHAVIVPLPVFHGELRSQLPFELERAATARPFHSILSAAKDLNPAANGGKVRIAAQDAATQAARTWKPNALEQQRLANVRPVDRFAAFLIETTGDEIKPSRLAQLKALLH